MKKDASISELHSPCFNQASPTQMAALHRSGGLIDLCMLAALAGFSGTTAFAAPAPDTYTMSVTVPAVPGKTASATVGTPVTATIQAMTSATPPAVDTSSVASFMIGTTDPTAIITDDTGAAIPPTGLQLKAGTRTVLVTFKAEGNWTISAIINGTIFSSAPIQVSAAAPAAPAPVNGAGPAANPAAVPVAVGLSVSWIDPTTMTTHDASSTDPIPQVAECTQLTLYVTANQSGGNTKSPVSGTVLLTDSLLPGSSQSILISNGTGTATVPVLAPGIHKLTASFEGTDKYPQTQSGSLTVNVNHARGQSATCPYPMPPLLLSVVGLDVEGASSASPSATFLGNATIDLPLPGGPLPSGRMTNIDKARFFIGASARIAGMAQPGALSATSFTQNYFSTAINSTPDKIVQSWEGSGSFAIKFWSTSLGMGTFDNGKPPSQTYPRNTRITTSFLLSGGFNSPLSASQASPIVYYATQQIQNDYNSKINPAWPTWASSCLNYLSTTPVGTPSCYVAFIPADRLRFYRNYEAGLRFKIYGEDFDHNILRFPGIVDLTAGQNEYVTGGGFNGVVVHVGGVLPVPIANVPGIYAFGATDSEINGPVGGGAQLLLEPVPSTANVNYLSNSVYDITVPQPNRDRYRFGFGIDIYQLLTNKPQKQGTTSQ